MNVIDDMAMIALIIICLVALPLALILRYYKPKPVRCKLSSKCDYYQPYGVTCNSETDPDYCGVFRDVAWHGVLSRLKRPENQ